MTSSYIYILAILSTLLTTFSAKDTHNCIHSQLDFEPQSIDISTEPELDGRSLLVTQNIRIHFDFSHLTNVDPVVKDYIENDITLPAENFLESTLKVKPVSGKLSFPRSMPTICSGAITVPPLYQQKGVAADLIIFVKASNEQQKTYIAYANACLLDSVTGRPVAGVLNYNLKYVKARLNSAQREENIIVTLHEVTHVLGFSSGLYSRFIDPATNKPLKGHILKRIINGVPQTVLNLAPLTARLKAHFNCSTLEGAFIENEGGSGSAGSHFERRILFNEYMTSSTILDQRISEFTLALLEGSGWYQVDYSKAEKITWGKNKGCDFLNTPCWDKATNRPNFEEFCSKLKKTGCSWTGRGYSYCGAASTIRDPNLPAAFDYWGDNITVFDNFADNCPIFQVFDNKDCEDPDSQDDAVIGNKEYYGVGSKCFMGTLGKTGQLSQPFGYCFKQRCELQDNGKYLLKVSVGGYQVICSSPGQLMGVPGLYGRLTCPDPAKFCTQTSAEGSCRRGCSGRGTCVNDQCQCNNGWTSFDCSKRTYVDNCQLCAGNPNNKTSCYGDTCACNPGFAICNSGSIVSDSSNIQTPPSVGGNTDNTGGETDPNNGGSSPSSGGSLPSSGGSSPDNGGNSPDNGGDSPDNGGNLPEEGGSLPDIGENSSNKGGNLPLIIGVAVGGAVLVASGVFLGLKFGKRLLRRPRTTAAAASPVKISKEAEL